MLFFSIQKKKYKNTNLEREKSDVQVEGDPVIAKKGRKGLVILRSIFSNH